MKIHKFCLAATATEMKFTKIIIIILSEAGENKFYFIFLFTVIVFGRETEHIGNS